jgi:hypothetical protein
LRDVVAAGRFYLSGPPKAKPHPSYGKSKSATAKSNFTTQFL